jgi:hypothetical protein
MSSKKRNRDHAAAQARIYLLDPSLVMRYDNLQGFPHDVTNGSRWLIRLLHDGDDRDEPAQEIWVVNIFPWLDSSAFERCKRVSHLFALLVKRTIVNIRADLTRGRRSQPVSCVNEVDEEPFPTFISIPEVRLPPGLTNKRMGGSGCTCTQEGNREGTGTPVVTAPANGESSDAESNRGLCCSNITCPCYARARQLGPGA